MAAAIKRSLTTQLTRLSKAEVMCCTSPAGKAAIKNDKKQLTDLKLNFIYFIFVIGIAYLMNNVCIPHTTCCTAAYAADVST
jgi:hypothetical protein